jgi:hypothetical protein
MELMQQQQRRVINMRFEKVWVLIVFILISCGASNAQAFKNKYPAVFSKVNVLFHFWEHGEFDSLYNHFSDSAKSIYPKDAFLKKYNEMFKVSRTKNIKILQYKLFNDSTFEIFFSYDDFSPPNSYRMHYSFDSVSNTFQFRSHGKTCWDIAWRNKKLYFTPIVSG